MGSQGVISNNIKDMPEPGTQAKLEEQFVSEAIPIGLPWRLLVFATILFGFALLIYFGLRFGYANFLNAEAENLDKKIEELSLQVREEDQQNFINFYSQLINLKKVLDRHIFPSNIFNFLEKNTLGNVYYNRAEFSAREKSLDLSGLANGAQVLVQQLSLFDRASELDGVILEQMSLDPKSGGATFAAKLNFDDNFLPLPR